MSQTLIAGVWYFVIVFAIGFALGTLRTLFLVPRLGETIAVLIEIPIMVAASYFVALWLVDRFLVPAQVDARMTMGLIAFVLLMLAELTLSTTLMGRSLSEHFEHYRTMGGLLGLGGQILFALMPVVMLLR